MTQIDKDLLLRALEDAGEKPAPFALKIGRDKDFIADYIKGRKRSFKLEDARNIADALNVPLEALTGGKETVSKVKDAGGIEVVGKVAAGIYKDISVEDQDTYRPKITLARDMRWPYAKQYALEVAGDSMDLLFPDGSIVVCVDYVGSGMALKEGMPVHVERYMMGGQLIEATLKEVGKEDDGSIMLYPRSSNPSHKPLTVAFDGDGDVRVRGIVIGEWKPFKFGF